MREIAPHGPTAVVHDRYTSCASVDSKLHAHDFWLLMSMHHIGAHLCEFMSACRLPRNSTMW